MSADPDLKKIKELAEQFAESFRLIGSGFFLLSDCMGKAARELDDPGEGK